MPGSCIMSSAYPLTTVDSVITHTLFSPFFVDCHRCTVLSSFFKHSFKGHQPKEIRPKIPRALLFETVEITLKKEVWVMTESTVAQVHSASSSNLTEFLAPFSE